jgi:caa(3)-type oxidase subunit IV
MKTSVLILVWVYMVIAVLAEVSASYLLGAGLIQTAVIAILAVSQAITVVLFFMHLREEPGSIKVFALIPLMFLAALLIAMLASLG